MTSIGFGDGTVCVDASIIGEGLKLDAAAVLMLMREGEITDLCERGVNRDTGCYRLTFFHRNQRFRLVVTEAG